MQTLGKLIKRNIKMFFKDKALFFTSLITPVILLVLYATFLARVYRQTFEQVLPADTPAKLISAAVGGQLFSSLLAVCCVTVAFCSNMLMVQDKVSGARSDIGITPVRRSTVAVAYYVASVCATLIVCLTATAACLIYVACTGWYMRAVDILLILLDVVLLVLFGTGLSSVINFFLSSQGQISAVGTIVSAGYGFICGAYMPISQFGSAVGKFMSFLPGTYGTSLVRNHTMAGVFAEMARIGYPAEMIGEIRNDLDCNLYFFSHSVPVGAMYGILIGAVVLILGAYVLLNVCLGNKKTAPLRRVRAKKQADA